MLASVQQDGLKMTVTPGFTWDSEQCIFKGPVLYGDEILTLCIRRERMQRSIMSCLDADKDIESLFDPAQWIAEAEHVHEPDVYFEDEGDLGPELMREA
jgi:hypothetical protein